MIDILQHCTFQPQIVEGMSFFFMCSLFGMLCFTLHTYQLQCIWLELNYLV